MRKPDSLLLLGAIVGLSVIATTLAHADSVGYEQAAAAGLQKPSPGCLGAAPGPVPCASSSVHAYHYAGFSEQVSNAMEELDGELSAPQLLMSIKIGPSWQSDWRLFKHHRGVNLNLGLDYHGPIMNLDFGRLDLNMVLEDGGDTLVEPHFFLGIDDRW